MMSDCSDMEYSSGNDGEFDEDYYNAGKILPSIDDCIYAVSERMIH